MVLAAQDQGMFAPRGTFDNRSGRGANVRSRLATASFTGRHRCRSPRWPRPGRRGHMNPISASPTGCCIGSLAARSKAKVFITVDHHASSHELADGCRTHSHNCGQGDRPNGPQARRRPLACRIAADPSGRPTWRLWRPDIPFGTTSSMQACRPSVSQWVGVTATQFSNHGHYICVIINFFTGHH